MIDKLVSIIDDLLPWIRKIVDNRRKKSNCKKTIDNATPAQRNVLNELRNGKKIYKDSHEGIDSLLRKGVVYRGSFVGTPNYVGNDFSEDLNNPTHWYGLTEYAEKYLQSK